MADVDNFAAFCSVSGSADTKAAAPGAAEDSLMEKALGWDTDACIKHLQTLGLPDSVLASVRDLEVTGADLVTLTVPELKVDLAITKLQAKRIKRSLGIADQVDEATDAADRKCAQGHDKTGVVPACQDHGAAEMPTTAAVLQAQSSMRRSRAAPRAQAVVVDPALVATWVSKTTLIAKLEGEQVGTRLPAAQQRLAYLQQTFASERAKFKEYEKANQELEKKHEELDGGAWYPGKHIMGKSNREEKLEKAEATAQESKRKLEASQRVLQDLSEKVQLQEQELAKLSAQVQSLNEAKQWEASALLNAFGGSAGDERENALEQEVAAIVPQLENSRRTRAAYGQAHELMRGARKSLDGAAQHFQAAHGAANLDVMQDVFKPRGMRNSPMGIMADVAKRAQNQQGVQLSEQAAQYIIRAAQIIPDMPRVDLQKVNKLKEVGMMMDIVFDNVISDMRSRQKIQESMQLVQTMLRDVTYAERWLEGWITGRIDGDLRALEGNYATKKAELDHYRRDLLQGLVVKA